MFSIALKFQSRSYDGTPELCKKLIQSLNPQTSHTKTLLLFIKDLDDAYVAAIDKLIAELDKATAAYTHVHIRLYAFGAFQKMLLLRYVQSIFHESWYKFEVLSTFNASTSKMKVEGL